MTAETAPTTRRSWLVDFYRSAVGKKWVMAVTGIVLLAYVLAHMVGNLKIYLGPGELDEYAEALRDLLHPILPRHVALWLMRTGLIVAFLLHVHAATVLTFMNRRARAVVYQGPREYLVANYASRTMRWSGYIVGAFVIFHLMDLTWAIQPAATDQFVRGEVYTNVVASFSRVPVAVFYILANLLLGLHIYHGAWSMFQSLGVNNPRFNAWRRWFAQALAAVIVVGNVSFPVAVLAGWVG
ncbi:MAG: succinate dehydrogenase cytochrome b subunit [Acidimicrobiia bacterium]